MQTDILKNIKNYTKDTDPGPFSKNNGFLYNLELDGTFYKGFTVEEINCNKAGIAHGGTLIAFADGIMGYTAWKKDSFPCLTANDLILKEISFDFSNIFLSLDLDISFFCFSKFSLS